MDDFGCGDPYFVCIGCPNCMGDPSDDSRAISLEFPPTEGPAESYGGDSDSGHEPGHDYEMHDSSDGEEAPEDLMDLEVVPETTHDSSESSDSEDSSESEESEPMELSESDDSSDEASYASDATVQSPLVLTRQGEILRSRLDPLPPPSFQVYRHPGGVRWMHTPRKGVAPPAAPERFQLPLSPVSSAPVPTASIPSLAFRPEEFLRGAASDRSPSALDGRLARAEEMIQELTTALGQLRRAAAAAEYQAIMAASREMERDARIRSLTDELGEARREIGALRRDHLFRDLEAFPPQLPQP